jgi:nitrite reductase/ring-hydroxylating ferredoxin subunit
MTQFLTHTHAIEDDDAKGFEVDGHSIFVVKKDGQFHVYVNSCPHIGITLEFQPDQFMDADRQFIQCANHGALFEPDTGYCVAGPCSGKSLTPVSHEIRDDAIYIALDSTHSAQRK